MAQHTVIPVLYRDEDNWKSHAEYHLLGAIDQMQLARLREALPAGYQFIPAQIGQDHISDMTITERDGPWHELGLDDIEIVDTVPHGNRLHAAMGVEEFVRLIEEHAATGWRPQDFAVEPGQG